MKKTIAGRTYDPQSAKWIAEHVENARDDDLYTCESLYRKRNGEFFLHCEGGKKSRYSDFNSITWEPDVGFEIVPLSYDAAKQWAQKYCTPDAMAQIFGNKNTDERTNLTLSLRKATVEQLRRLAADQRTTMSNIVEKLVNEHS